MHHANRDRYVRALSRCVWLLAAMLVAALIGPQARAQRSGDFGMTYVQERSKFVGSADSDYFYLRGAKLDVGVNLWKGIGVAGSADGLAATNIRGSIDIQHIQFMVGPRYTFNLGRITDTSWNRRGGIFVEGKVGYTLAPAGLYPNNGVEKTQASSLTYDGGGGINITIYHRFDVRIIEAGIVRTQFPNGGTNIQNTLRFGSGINFHFGQ